MADCNLTTESAVLAYLQSGPFPGSKDAKRLSDGFCGFVYRVENEPQRDIAQSFIVKHVQGYAARAPAFKLDQSRLAYEHRALSLLPEVLGQARSDDVKLPKVLHYDGEAHVLALQDVGCVPSLKAWLTASSPVHICRSIGSSLGRFLAKVHRLHVEHPSVIAEFDLNTTAKQLSALVYFDNLPAAAANFDFHDKFIAEAAAEGREEVLGAKEVFTVGDFWPGNVLVAPRSGADDEIPGVDLYLLDLELSKPGTGAFDVGQMAAELYCMARYRGGEGGRALLGSFLREYKSRHDQVNAAKVAIRIGAHLVVIGPMGWGQEIGAERLRELVALGVDLIRAGWTRDVQALQNSVVAPLMNVTGA